MDSFVSELRRYLELSSLEVNSSFFYFSLHSFNLIDDKTYLLLHFN